MKQLATYRNSRRQVDPKEHVKETESKASRILREINGISSKQNVGEEEIRVKIELFETCLAPAYCMGLKQAWRWGKIPK